MFRKIITSAFVFAALGAGLFLMDQPSAFAATTYVVTSDSDLPDADIGDPACKTANGSCTLRAAVEQADFQSGSETVALQPNTTYFLSLGGLNMTGDISVIGGTNTIVDGSLNTLLDPVFMTGMNDHVTLQDLTIRGGKRSGILNSGSLTIERVTVTDNAWTNHGGGIINLGTLIVNESTIRDNTAGINGGGIFNDGTAFIYNSTLNGNEATLQQGGAIYNGEGAVLDVVNSTLSGNRAGLHGGGIANHKQAVAQLYNVTIVLNKAEWNNDGGGDGGGVYNNNGPLGMSHTLVALNHIENGQFDIQNDCGGFFVSNGYNLVREPGSCVIYGEDTNGIGLDPKFGPLADNGGRTMTHALLQGSQAIDLGNLNSCPGAGGYDLVRDQRNYTRIVDGNGVGGVRCDVGAVEYAGTPIEPPACSVKPVKATLKKPTDGSTVTTLRVKLNWNDVPCADTYKVRVRQDSKHGPSADKKNGLTKSKYKTDPIDPGHTYYWRVLACNQHGCSRSVFSTFTLNP